MTQAAAAATTRVPVDAIAFTSDGASVAVNGYREIIFRSMADGQIQRRVRCDLERITGLAFFESSPLVLAGGGVPGENGSVLALNGSSGILEWKIEPHDDLITNFSISPDGALLATASADGDVKIFRLHSPGREPKHEQTFSDHSGPVLDLLFTPDGQSLVTSSADRTLKVWRVADGTLQRTFGNHTGIVHCLALRPAAQTGNGTAPVACASGSEDSTVRIWQPQIGRMVRIVRQHKGSVLALAYSADGKQLFSAGKEGMIRAIDAESDQILREWPAHPDWIYEMAVTPNGQWLISGDWAGELRAWDLTQTMPRRIW
jgi:WD40 repeat protein